MHFGFKMVHLQVCCGHFYGLLRGFLFKKPPLIHTLQAQNGC